MAYSSNLSKIIFSIVSPNSNITDESISIFRPKFSITGSIKTMISLDSSVMLEFGDTIEKIILDKLDEYAISDIHLIVKDKGALDPTINARLETAILRACDFQKGTLI